MNQNKLLYNIVKIANSAPRQYDPTIAKHMARQMGEQSVQNENREAQRQDKINQYMASGKMTPEEAQRRLNASRRADWGIKQDTAMEDAQRYNDYITTTRQNPEYYGFGGLQQYSRNAMGDVKAFGNYVKNKAKQVGGYVRNAVVNTSNAFGRHVNNVEKQGGGLIGPGAPKQSQAMGTPSMPFGVNVPRFFGK